MPYSDRSAFIRHGVIFFELHTKFAGDVFSIEPLLPASQAVLADKLAKQRGKQLDQVTKGGVSYCGELAELAPTKKAAQKRKQQREAKDQQAEPSKSKPMKAIALLEGAPPVALQEMSE